MQTRTGLTYGDSEKRINTMQICTNFGKSYLNTPFPKVEIDFDEASNAWKLNKKYVGNGCYKYKCIKMTKNGKACKNESLYNCNYCRFHINCRNIENQNL
jgi:hypothetical protein